MNSSIFASDLLQDIETVCQQAISQPQQTSSAPDADQSISFSTISYLLSRQESKDKVLDSPMISIIFVLAASTVNNTETLVWESLQQVCAAGSAFSLASAAQSLSDNRAKGKQYVC